MHDLGAVELVYFAALLIGTGAIAGFLAGLLGVGGGIVIVPVLFVVLDVLGVSRDMLMHVAVGTSLATIVPTSISSARAHNKKGAIDPALLRAWGAFIFLGAATGGLLSAVLKSAQLTLIFGAVAVVVALNMARRRPIVLSDSTPSSVAPRVLIPYGIGTFSALMGIGGGTLSVPVLSAFSVPVHRAVGTSSLFGLLIAVPAMIGFMWSGWGLPDRPPLSLGYVSVPAAVLIFSASVFVAPVGASVAHAINARALRLAFACFLALSGIRMLWSVLG